MKRAVAILVVLLSACSLAPKVASPVLHGLSAKYTVQVMLQNPTLINGYPAEPELWPASVYARVDNGACSATLVGQRVLFIAAHCVADGGLISFSAHANNYRATCTQHPDYKKGSGNITADWALCLVERPVTGVEFESLGVGEKVVIGQEVTLSGYGCVVPGGGGGNDGIFRIGKATVDGLPSGTDFDVVTKGGAALCFGDSGGAAYLVDSERRVIFGVNSRGDINAMSYLPSVASKIFIDFARSWSKSSNNVRICGLHSDALYCRNTGINGPLFPVVTPPSKVAPPKVERRIKNGRQHHALFDVRSFDPRTLWINGLRGARLFGC